MRSILLFLLLCFSLAVSAETPYEQWKKKIIQNGKKRLAEIRARNIENDRVGQSYLNQYVVVISSEEEYPNGDFLKQRRGTGRGAGSSVNYILDSQTLGSLDKTLRTMNEGSEIKTFVLLVHYMPLEFTAELPDNVSIAEFFNGASTDVVKAVAEPVSKEAGSIVKDITSAQLATSTEPTLYCGFVNFKVFKNEKEGFSQWVYYPHNSEQLQFDVEYKNMLSSFVRSTKWPSEDVAKTVTLIDVISKNNTEYLKNKGALGSLLAIEDPDKMEEAVSSMTLMGLGALTTETRVHALKVLSAGVVNDTRAREINELIETVNTSADADKLISAMSILNDKVPGTITITYDGLKQELRNPKEGWCLLQCLTHELTDARFGVFGDDSYNRLIKAFIKLCRGSKVFKDKAAVLADTANNDLIESRTIIYNYNSIWVKLAATFSHFPNPRIERSTGYVDYCEIETKADLFFSYVTGNPNVSKTQLDPFEPIVFVNKSDLGMLGGLSSEGNIFVAPSVVLKYADDKAWNESATDATMAVIDATSMATGYGEIKAGVTGLRKAWVMLDMFNSGINLTLNASLATENPKVKKIMDAYNAVTGVVALGDAAYSLRTLYTFTKGKKVLEMENLKVLMAALEEGGEDALKYFDERDIQSIEGLVSRVMKEANARSLTPLELQAVKVLEKIRMITRFKQYTKLAAKLDQLEKISAGAKQKFMGDFVLAPDDVLKRFDDNDGLVDSWKAVKDLPESIRKNTVDLEIISDYMKRSGKSADDIASEIPSNVTDAKKWLGDRKIEPFLSQNPQISSVSAPAGYQIYEVNGSKYIRRVDAENPYTPQLTVDENGVIVRYTKPSRISVSARFSKNLEDIYGALPTNHQRHHLVPDNVVRNSPLHQEAIKRGLYDLDRGANGRYLAETAEDFVHDASGLSSKFPTHLGSHPKYDAAIQGQIDNVIEQFDVDIFDLQKLSNSQITDLLNEIENRAVTTLTNWRPSSLN
jgi:hypothetical protein